jgi:hypothetical protein
LSHRYFAVILTEITAETWDEICGGDDVNSDLQGFKNQFETSSNFFDMNVADGTNIIERLRNTFLPVQTNKEIPLRKFESTVKYFLPTGRLCVGKWLH